MNHDIILENQQFRLVIGSDCVAKSLLHKASGEECLQPGAEMPLFALTEPRPYNNEIKLAHPNKRTTFQANRVRREGNKLIVGFEIILHEAVVEIKETPDYISFRLVEFLLNPGDTQFHLYLAAVPAEAFRLLQLPVKNRKYFGQWINVVWDDAVAVNVLATAPYAIVDAEERKDYRILTAEAQRGVKMTGTEAALIVTESNRLLDTIDQLEKDYNLPRGVESRRSKEIKMSWYWTGDVNPDNVDDHIRYCKRMGYRMMTIYFPSIFDFGYDRCGDYDECNFRSSYPNGYESLRAMVQKIRDAGITPGLHFLHPHIGLKSSYVTPVADHRLHKLRYFTLAKPLDLESTTIYVEENPEDSVLGEELCQVLQFGGELISYENFSTEWPYCFTGCKRGYLDTHVTEHPLGQIGGLLDVSEFGAITCYLDQNSSIQDEISAKLAKIYNLGFAFIYFDGSEGTNEPFAFHVPNGQYRTYKLMEPAPLLAEGAAKSHFSWHMISGGNAFDVFTPDVFKDMIRAHPAAEAVRMKQDFTRLNFGWWGSSYGPALQPDHWEYGNLLAASWDCPATVQANLEGFAKHPRVDDLLEVLRRWEDVRINGWLTDEQKEEIHANEKQERILLINEAREYELVPYDRISAADEKLCAYGFERQGRSYVVFWHTHGAGTLKLSVPVAVQDELYSQPEVTDMLSVSGRRYASAEMPLNELVQLFAAAKLDD